MSERKFKTFKISCSLYRGGKWSDVEFNVQSKTKPTTKDVIRFFHDEDHIDNLKVEGK